MIVLKTTTGIVLALPGYQ